MMQNLPHSKSIQIDYLGSIHYSYAKHVNVVSPAIPIRQIRHQMAGDSGCGEVLTSLQYPYFPQLHL